MSLWFAKGTAIAQLPQQYTIWLKLPGNFGQTWTLLYILHLVRHKANHPTPMQSWTRILQVLTCHCQKRQPCQKSKLLSARNPIKGSIENPRVSLERQLWTLLCRATTLTFPGYVRIVRKWTLRMFYPEPLPQSRKIFSDFFAFAHFTGQSSTPAWNNATISFFSVRFKTWK